MAKPPKRILVDIGHPAHVHLFRNAIKIWQAHGHDVTITSREKDITGTLLSAYGYPMKLPQKPGRAPWALPMRCSNMITACSKQQFNTKARY
jgi:hypothetical protein